MLNPSPRWPDPARLAPAVPPEAVWRLIGRLFFGAAFGTGVTVAVLLGLLDLDLPPRLQLAQAVAYVIFALIGAWAWWRSADPRFPVPQVLFVVALMAIALTAASSLVHGSGLNSPAYGFFGLVVCMLCAVSGPRQGLILALWASISVGAVGWAQWRGLVAPLGDTAVVLGLAFQWLVIACGAVAGMLISRVLAHYLRDSAEREQRFRALLGIAVDWYWEQDEEFRFTFFTDSRTGHGDAAAAHSDALGRTPWEQSGLGLGDDQLDAHRADLEAHRAFSNLMVTRRDRSGRQRHVAISGAPKFNAEGMFLGYWGVGRDVSAQVRAQRAVAASENRYRALFAMSPSPLVLHRRGIVLDANEATAQLFGYRDAMAMKGVNLIDHFVAAAQQRPLLRELMQRTEQLELGGTVPPVDYQMTTLDGRSVALQATATCVDGPGGPAILTIYVDITARKAAEAAVRRSEAMLSHLIATSPDVMTLTDIDSGRFVLVNDRFVNLFGWAREEAIGRTSIELGTWHDTDDRVRFVEQVRRDGTVEGMPLIFRRRDGTRMPMLVSGARLAFEGQRLLVLTARDVSASEQTRLEVEAILNTVSLAIAFVRDQRIVRVNARHTAMFGWSEDDLRGSSLITMWPDPVQYQMLRRQAVVKLRRREGYECETQLRRRDGSLLWCRLQAQSVDPANPIGGGTIWSAEDITQRREFEHALAAARDAAEAASRAKSAFLANTSHEIRTPLNGLLGLARLAMQPGLSEVRREQYLAQIVDSTQSLAGIISDILDLSKVEAGRITLEDLVFDLHHTLTSVHDGYLSLAEAKSLTLTLAIGEDLPASVRGDPLRVRQILTNFVANAIKFTESGSVFVEAMRCGDGIRFAVRDTGPGIASETQRRLFMPFSQADESTTRRYGGTGLGLSICRELAQLMGGRVGVTSAPGEGSTFWAELPLPAAAPGALPGPADPALDAPLQGAHVLIAEDNPVNMLIAAAMLEQWGLRVTQAPDGAAAVAAVAAAADAGTPFDLVLMDVHMPVMSGHAAVRELRRRFDADQLPVVALTAAALVSERDEALASGMNDFLTKPIDVSRLRATLARFLRRTTDV